MTEVAAQFSYAISSAFLNKEMLLPEKGTWRNKENQTIDNLFEDIRQGLATTSYLALNATNLPEYIAQHGLPNPALGPYRREYAGQSERCNGNAQPDRLINFDIDGDCTIEHLQSLPTVQQLAAGISTSSSHTRKNDGAPSNHRMRLHFILPYALPTYFDDECYSDPLWTWLAVRRHLRSLLEADLGTALIDKCGDDPGRIWYGNAGLGTTIGGPKGQDLEAGESIQIKLGNTVTTEVVKTAISKYEPEYTRSTEEIERAQAIEAKLEAGDFETGTPKQVKTAAYILSNGILSAQRATDYHTWYLVARVCKKLDPTGSALQAPFLQFCQQSNNPDNTETEETVAALWDKLPEPEETKAGITSLKDAADEDTPGWRERCPLFGNSVQAQTIVNYLPMGHSSFTTQYLRYLQQKKAGKLPAEQDQPANQTSNQLTDYDYDNSEPTSIDTSSDF